jgi:hypothetical protein
MAEALGKAVGGASSMAAVAALQTVDAMAVLYFSNKQMCPNGWPGVITCGVLYAALRYAGANATAGGGLGPAMGKLLT